MSKINYTNPQNQSEVECVARFLNVYNNIRNTNFSNIVKNAIQNEIDVYCYDSDENILKIQIKKSDPKFAGDVGKSKKISINNYKDKSLFRDGDKTKDRIISNIVDVIGKYRIQNKDMSDIILLLDELVDPPKIIFNNFSIGIKSTFKEIWFVPRMGCPFELM